MNIRARFLNKRQSDAASEACSVSLIIEGNGMTRYKKREGKVLQLLSVQMASFISGNVSESTRVSDVDVDLSCDILFSFEFFTLLVLLLLNSNSTVNHHQTIQTFFLQSIHTGQFWSKIKVAT